MSDGHKGKRYIHRYDKYNLFMIDNGTVLIILLTHFVL